MDEVDRAMVSVRADTRGFLSDVASMRDALESGLGHSAARAGGLVEQALLKAARTGKLSFEDLKATALRVMDQIAAAALRSAVHSIVVGSSGGSGSATAGGQPGRATGGPVAPGRGYLVGERGPLSGQSAPSGTSYSGQRGMPKVDDYQAGRSAEPKAGGDQPDDCQAMRCVGGS